MGIPRMIVLSLLVSLLSLARSSSSPERGFCDNKNILQHQIQREAVPSLARTPATKNNDPTPDLIWRAGYPAETHYATTPDGYILALHRIPHGKNNGGEDITRPVIFVQHGLLCSSSDWVISTPTKGLGYILADAGYDVWLGNYRGNTYSRNHTFLNPDDQRGGFWDFTWDEMAHYDIPTMIEKVLELTGESELFYAGHSMGTTAFMAMHHYRPDIGQKVRLANFLAPVASESAMGGPLGWIAGFMDGIFDWVLEDLLNMMGVGEFLPSNLFMDCLASLFCHSATADLCSNILFIIAGFDEQQMNKTLLDTIMHHYQLKVVTPVALYWGDNDWFA